MNKRVMIGAVLGVTFFLFAHRPASAMVEFCPASLQYQAVTSGTPAAQQQSQPDAALYGFELKALAARTLSSARLVFDTSGGWYTVDLAGVAMTPKDRHYNGPLQSYVVRDYASPVMYVRFPSAVGVAHAWVYSAAPANGAPVTCDPPPAPSPEQLGRSKAFRRRLRNSGPALDPKDDDHLSAAPSSTSRILAAAPTKPLETVDCAEPFRDADVVTQAQARFPDAAKPFVSGPVVSIAALAIDADGSTADSELWASSGFHVLDEEALRVAQQSTYSGARSYCRPVPSHYFFRVTFDPNS